MTSQSVVKLLLTEGDKVILSWFSPLQDQGGYAIAVNYGQYPFSFPLACLANSDAYLSLHIGSLLARIVFQPVEEASRIYFSKAISGTSSKSATGVPNDGNLRQAATALISLLSVQSSLSVVLLVFGTAYMPIALYILLPQQYLSTSAPKVLSAWVWYIPVLAFNGVLEAFLSSVATPRDLNNQSR
jgi:oligosaccharide translocation protein RFT1